MNNLKKDLEVLKSWGIESIPIDKVLSLIEGEDVTLRFPLGDQITVIPSGITTTASVGGTIFYIDDKADGIYEFFDVDGNLIKDVKVGDRPHAYRIVAKGAKDKYYVYHDEMHMAKRWTYLKDESFVYDAINLLGKGIGKGKTNTEIMMARDNGAYVTANSSGCPTIWYQLQRARDAKVSGCDDWFVPSVDEFEELRKAVESGSVRGGIIAGSSYNTSVFKNKHLWSSSEASLMSAYAWDLEDQYWDGIGKYGLFSVLFARAF